MKFPEHKASLIITHNEHKAIYEKIEDYIENSNSEEMKKMGFEDQFKDEEAIKRCITTDEIWELQWYPNTPIGFYRVCAPTFEEVISLALEVEAEIQKEKEL